MATEEKHLKITENDIIAKLSKNHISVKIGCLKFLDSYRFLDASLDKLSLTLTFFRSLDKTVWKMIYPNENSLIPMKRVTTLNHFTND